MTYLTRTLFLLSLFALAQFRLAIAQHDVIAHISASLPPGRPFQGQIDLSVTATDMNHQIFVVREIITIQTPGPLTLLYPEWEPGSHAPTASVAELAGLIIHANDQRIEWLRDPIQTHAFHIEVPAGTKTISVEFEFLALRSAALLRPGMIEVPWHRLLVYPANYSLKNLPVVARLTLPEGMHPFTSLDVAKTESHTFIFAPTTLDDLVDAPVYAGRYWLQRELGQNDGAPVRLDVLADRANQISVTQDEVKKLHDMITQTKLVFGPAPEASSIPRKERTICRPTTSPICRIN
ncbi:hypothetical protein RBB79_11405 [Tunturiibacter empetritectus]|uniref:Metalloprotease with PDZ domain n=1 Tax=Tunturiibacter lichenicola TaxID=2051959 RepID=A0A852VG23_9BACT|nr:hypothetical protein [Edaphobacter lichenicola]NYF90181.1 putative metalloprotease with PDZ domain [Edaphobacter lichenicola]